MIPDSVQPVHVEIAAQGEHVGNIDRKIRSVKEKVRCTTSAKKNGIQTDAEGNDQQEPEGQGVLVKCFQTKRLHTSSNRTSRYDPGGRQA